MEKIIVKVEFNSASIEGVAQFDTKQLESLTFSAGVRLNRDLLYFAPKQWIHSEKLKTAFNGHTHSNKIFLFGLDPATKNVVSMTTIAVSSLTGIFYGTTKEFPQGMQIASVKKGKVNRAVTGTTMVSVFKNGGFSFDKKDKQAYVSRPVMFTFEGREEVWTSKLKNTGTAANPTWDMEVDGENLKLIRAMANTFDEKLDTFEPKITADIIGESNYKVFEKMLKALPE